MRQSSGEAAKWLEIPTKSLHTSNLEVMMFSVRKLKPWSTALQQRQQQQQTFHVQLTTNYFPSEWLIVGMRNFPSTSSLLFLLT